MTKTIQIPNNWQKVGLNLYKFKDVLIDTYKFEDGGIPYQVLNPLLNNNKNTKFWSYEWQDILDYVYGDDANRLRMKRDILKLA